MVKKKLEKKVEFDNLFGKQPYNLKLSYMDVFGMLSFLNDDGFYLLNLCFDASHELEVTNTLFECAPSIINNDEDFMLWIRNFEKESPIGNLTISWEGYYHETIEHFKKAIIATKKNQDSMSFEKVEKLQIQMTDWVVDFIFETYGNEHIACLSKDQSELALRKKEQALSLLQDIGDMFGELKMQLIKYDEKTGMPIYPLTPKN